jgi:hypothetical protein
MLAGIGVSNWMVRALMAAQIFTSHPDRHHHHPLEFLSLFNRPPISPPIAVFPPTSRFASRAQCFCELRKARTAASFERRNVKCKPTWPRECDFERRY